MKEQLFSLVKAGMKLLPDASEKAEVPVQIEWSRDAKFGDYACNAAMVLAKVLGKNPRELAKQLIDCIPSHAWVAKMEVAGPGFINIFVSDDAWQACLQQVFTAKETYGHTTLGNGEKILIEYVSANPTGPLHVGHGRGAAFGSALARLLKVAGYQVDTEYYINDAGRQMDILTLSAWLRYLQLLSYNDDFPFPKRAYHGEYIQTIAERLKEKQGDRLKRDASQFIEGLPPEPEDEKTGGIYLDALIARAKSLLQSDYAQVHAYVTESILSDIRRDLTEFGVDFTRWYSEQSLVEKGAVKQAIDALQKTDTLYEKDGALWFRSTQFGDDRDRVLVRSNGETTYFASDVAYHYDKFQRGYEHVIDILGADHHGYVTRVRAALQALMLPHDRFHVMLVQFAILYRGKERVQMSTRSGSFVTLRELREEVGNDATRFYYVMRRPEQHLDFDLELAKSKSMENPLYYIQYAHARICSVFKQLNEKGMEWKQDQAQRAIDRLTTPHEKLLLRDIMRYPEAILQAAKAFAPHQIAQFLRELATNFHAYYNAETFLVEEETLKQARLTLIQAVKRVLTNGLALLGITPLESM